MKIKKFNESIMVMVPHQDDELLLTAGVIERAVKEGVEVTVVMVTNGDYECSDYAIGQKRMQETLEGLQVLGISPKQVIFLGYADTGMPWQDSFIGQLWECKEAEKVFPSSCGKETYGLEDKPDYHSLTYGMPGLYNRKTFLQDITDVLDEYRPGVLFTTAPYDIHGDHKALYLFVMQALKQLEEEKKYRPVVYSGIVHSFAGDDKWPKPLEFTKEGKALETLPYLACPEDFEQTCPLKWADRVSFEVPEDMQDLELCKNKKYIAISKHQTALKPDAIEYLYSFVKKDEIFWRY